MKIPNSPILPALFGRRTQKVRQTLGSRLFDILNVLVLWGLVLFTLGPFLYILFGSITEADYYRVHGVALDPRTGRWPRTRCS